MPINKQLTKVNQCFDWINMRKIKNRQTITKINLKYKYNRIGNSDCKVTQ